MTQPFYFLVLTKEKRIKTCIQIFITAFFCNNLKQEVTMMSINWWMNKQIMYLYNGILLGNKEWMNYGYMQWHEWIWNHDAELKEAKPKKVSAIQLHLYETLGNAN